MNLYGECLVEEPIYIPRKFRNDKYHVMSQEERNVLTKLNIKKFQSECEILKIRRDRFTMEITEKDDQIKAFVESNTSNNNSKSQLLKLHIDEINRDIEKINNSWKKKIQSTKKAFQQDKEQLQQNQQRHQQQPTNLNSHEDIKQNEHTNYDTIEQQTIHQQMPDEDETSNNNNKRSKRSQQSKNDNTRSITTKKKSNQKS